MHISKKILNLLKESGLEYPTSPFNLIGKRMTFYPENDKPEIGVLAVTLKPTGVVYLNDSIVISFPRTFLDPFWGIMTYTERLTWTKESGWEMLIYDKDNKNFVTLNGVLPLYSNLI